MSRPVTAGKHRVRNTRTKNWRRPSHRQVLRRLATKEEHAWHKLAAGSMVIDGHRSVVPELRLTHRHWWSLAIHRLMCKQCPAQGGCDSGDQSFSHRVPKISLFYGRSILRQATVVSHSNSARRNGQFRIFEGHCNLQIERQLFIKAR